MKELKEVMSAQEEARQEAIEALEARNHDERIEAVVLAIVPTFVSEHLRLIGHNAEERWEDMFDVAENIVQMGQRRGFFNVR